MELGGKETPAGIFLALWNSVTLSGPSARATAKKLGTRDQELVKEYLTRSDSSGAQGIVALLKAYEAKSQEDCIGCYLSVMRQIDEVFLKIHPRSRSLSGTKLSSSNPQWLQECEGARLSSGHYAAQDGKRLVPRGPLLRGHRNEFADSADTVADRFAALAVCNEIYDHDQRPISCRIKILEDSLIGGIAGRPSLKDQRVAFIPVAEVAEELVLTAVTRGSSQFVSCELSKAVDCAKRIFKALEHVGAVDFALAPELVVPNASIDNIKMAMSSSTLPMPRLLLAGSGHVTCETNKQPFNTSTILNQVGSVLWTQNKLWPAGFNSERATKLGLPDPGEGSLLEDNCSGSEIVVIDSHAIGRCVVLICQDFLARPLVDSLIRDLQPDWVFVPVLDVDTNVGRWTHRRSFQLADLSQARFLVVSSVALADKLGLNCSSIGLAIGPNEPAPLDGSVSNDVKRAVMVAKYPTGKSPEVVVLDWSKADWLTSHVGAQD